MKSPHLVLGVIFGALLPPCGLGSVSLSADHGYPDVYARSSHWERRFRIIII